MLRARQGENLGGGVVAPAGRGSSLRVGRLSSRLRMTVARADSEETPSVADVPLEYDRRGQRHLIWIDGVGGYLACLANEVVIGQSGPVSNDPDGPDIALQADLSRRHARIKRSEGQYVFSSRGAAKIDGRTVEDPVMLEDGAVIELGDSVRLRFDRPHALSATARLTVTSGHRTLPACDGVLLMAESCVLGPQPHSHVRCPKWRQEVLLYQGKGGLMGRSGAPLTVTTPGATPTEVADAAIPIPTGTRLEADQVSVTVEEA